VFRRWLALRWRETSLSDAEMEHGRLRPLQQQQQSAVSALLTADSTSCGDVMERACEDNTRDTAEFFIFAFNSESSYVSTEYNYTNTKCNT